MGKTSSSKDTICRYIKDIYGIDMVVSITTRKKRDCEVDGREHWFKTDEEFDKLDKSKMFAYTKFPKTNYRYCAMIDDLKDVNTYTLNPDGLKYLKENKDTLGIKYICIYCHLDEDTIKERARKRGDKEEDIIKRLDSERKEFDDFYVSKEYDYCIETGQSLDVIYKDVDKIMSEIGYTKQNSL